MTTEKKETTSALMLLQYGGDDSDEDTSFSELDSSGPAPAGVRKRRSSSRPRGDSKTPDKRRISDESYGKQGDGMISDEDVGHLEEKKSSTSNVDKEERTTEKDPEQTSLSMTMADVSKNMAPAVSTPNDNSNSSFPDSQAPKKKPKAPMRLVSYGADDLDDDDEEEEEQEESEEESSSEEEDDKSSDEGASTRLAIDGNNIQLPPEPSTKCSKEIQDKITDLYNRMRQQGFDTNNEIQRLTSFRNPSIYDKLIQTYHIDEKGSNFPLDVYNPHMWSKESFYDELDKTQKKDMERRERERKEKTKIEFIFGTKKSGSMGGAASDAYLSAEEKRRRSKWDALPPGLPATHSSSKPMPSGSSSNNPSGSSNTANPTTTNSNLTTSVTGTRATVISAVGSLAKKNSYNVVNVSAGADNKS